MEEENGQEGGGPAGAAVPHTRVPPTTAAPAPRRAKRDKGGRRVRRSGAAVKRTAHVSARHTPPRWNANGPRPTYGLNAPPRWIASQPRTVTRRGVTPLTHQPGRAPDTPDQGIHPTQDNTKVDGHTEVRAEKRPSAGAMNVTRAGGETTHPS